MDSTSRLEQDSPVFSPGFFATTPRSDMFMPWLPAPLTAPREPSAEQTTLPSVRTDNAAKADPSLSVTPSPVDFDAWMREQIGELPPVETITDIAAVDNAAKQSSSDAQHAWPPPAAYGFGFGSGICLNSGMRVDSSPSRHQLPPVAAQMTYPEPGQQQTQHYPFYFQGSTGLTPRFDSFSGFTPKYAGPTGLTPKFAGATGPTPKFAGPAGSTPRFELNVPAAVQDPFALPSATFPATLEPQPAFLDFNLNLNSPSFDFLAPHAQVPRRANPASRPLPLRDESSWNGRLRHKNKPAPLQLAGPSDMHAIATRGVRSRTESVSPRASRELDLRKGFDAEKPIADASRSWIRVNKSTQGLSTRCGKINAIDDIIHSNYETLPHTLGGDWQAGSGGAIFRYDDFELARRVYSAAELRQFIYEHPAPGGKGMVLWIERAPADSAKRYKREQSNKCKFAECPASLFSRSIQVGHFQVAFDENWTTHGARTDPFAMAGFAHLYCMERFLDFADVCRRFDVRADGRESLPEPTTRWAAGLGNGLQYDIAARFVSACKHGALQAKFPGYPAHDAGAGGAQKPHKATLNYALNSAKLKAIPKSKMDMLASRGKAASQIIVHRGDLELCVATRAAKAPARHANKLKRRRDSADERNDDGGDEAYDDEADVQTPRSRPARRARHHRRKHARVEDDSDDYNDAKAAEGAVRRRRKGRRTWKEDEDTPSPTTRALVEIRGDGQAVDVVTPGFEARLTESMNLGIAQMQRPLTLQAPVDADSSQMADVAMSQAKRVSEWQPVDFGLSATARQQTPDDLIDPLLWTEPAGDDLISPRMRTAEKSPFSLFLDT